MRVLTVSELKYKNSPGGGKADYPKDGSFALDILTALQSHKGHSVDLRILAHSRSRIDNFYTAVSQLTDMYGLDIRRVKRGTFLYVLAGEWFGSHYSDYCAEAFAKGVIDNEDQG